MATQSLSLPLLLPSGPDCERCLSRLQEALAGIRGIARTSVNNGEATIEVAYDPDMVTVSRIQQEAQRIGAELAEKIDHQTIEMRGLDCPDCARSIEKAVRQMNGVLWAGANFAASQIHVEYARDAASLQAICKTVEGHGVIACPLSRSTSEALPTSEQRADWRLWWNENRRLVVLAVVAVLALTASLVSPGQSSLVSKGLLAIAVVFGGWGTARSAYFALRARTLDMNVLMTLAVIGAASIGDWFEAASVVWLFNLGALLQAGAMENTRRSLRRLMNLTPKTARVQRNGVERDLPVEQVLAGDLVIVRPGERIPMDGEIVAGESAINEAPITGESVPRDKGIGDTVFAGALNGNGGLEVRTTRVYRDTTLARIIHRVEEAQAQRAPAQQMIDRFSHVYTPFVVGLALLVAVAPPLLVGAAWSLWYLRGLSLLIIACPCALVISTPVAIVTAIGAATRMGVLVKGGVYLEEVGRLRAILFDKTGTLTTGRFRLEEIIALGERKEADLLAVAAALEARSEHPLAAAFIEENHALNGHRHLSVTDFKALPGRGAQARVEGHVWSIGNRRMLDTGGLPSATAEQRETIVVHFEAQEARGKTVVALISQSGVEGLFILADSLRPDAVQTVKELRAAGIEHQTMLTGDNASIAKTIAETAGLTDWKAGLLPEDKLALVKEQHQRFERVGMVGDGVNDAPALAAADIGIAMGAAGNDTAMETADIALLSEDLLRLPALIRLSRRTSHIIRQNIAFSLTTKLGLIIAAVTVGLPLWLAVAGDVGVSLLVTLNALRLRG